MLYYLSERADGRIVLDREALGIILKTIEAPEPSVIRREVGGEIVEAPQYWESFSAARAKVDETGLIRTPEGWFRTSKAYQAYIRSRIGEAYQQ